WNLEFEISPEPVMPLETSKNLNFLIRCLNRCLNRFQPKSPSQR
ncbi:MAG: hypothetical protein ACI91J_000723, partial [Yoonia sp.]